MHFIWWGPQLQNQIWNCSTFVRTTNGKKGNIKPRPGALDIGLRLASSQVELLIWRLNRIPQFPKTGFVPLTEHHWSQWNDWNSQRNHFAWMRAWGSRVLQPVLVTIFVFSYFMDWTTNTVELTSAPARYTCIWCFSVMDIGLTGKYGTTLLSCSQKKNPKSFEVWTTK